MTQVRNLTEMNINTKDIRTLRYIAKHIEVKGYAPTLREIMATIGSNSTNGVRYQLDKLASAGFLRRDNNVARGISLTTASERFLSDHQNEEG